jgi:hypothetical protein
MAACGDTVLVLLYGLGTSLIGTGIFSPNGKSMKWEAAGIPQVLELRVQEIRESRHFVWTRKNQIAVLAPTEIFHCRFRLSLY